VHPRRKKSQWKPPGFFKGYCLAWAVILLTFWLLLVSNWPFPKREGDSSGEVTYVIIVEHEHGQKAKRYGDENPFNLQVPKVDEPASVLCGIKGLSDRDSLDIC
jgi:hypothetical protein